MQKATGWSCRSCRINIEDFNYKNETANFNKLITFDQDCYDCAPYKEKFYFPLKPNDKISISFIYYGTPQDPTGLWQDCGEKEPVVSIKGDGQDIQFEKSNKVRYNSLSGSPRSWEYSLNFVIPQDIKKITISIFVENGSWGPHDFVKYSFDCETTE
ncbi:MAG: hypothetical protein ACP5JU_01075 [Minisyncoccia bacterium]